MRPLHLQVEGIGVWAPGIADYAELRQARQAPPPPATSVPGRRPPAASLSPNERRRAPEGVVLAVEAADQAIAMSGRTADSLLSVFASSRGDQAITDYMCRTLADDPFALSPTRFHNSVHNAPAGYWSIAVGATGSSSSLSSEAQWTGLGLLDAMVLAVSETRPVLWVCSETAGAGPLLALSGYTHGMACALVLAPAMPNTDRPQLEASLQSVDDEASPAGHPVATLLPWLAMLADGGSRHLPVSPRQVLRIDARAGVL